MTGCVRKLLVVGVVVASALASAPPAGATFPGANGLVTWTVLRLRRDAEIWGRDLSTGVTVKITHNDRTDFEPAWSPDGQFLAYASSTATDVDVYTVNADGRDETNITNNDGQADRWPSWSPDGLWLVYSSQNFDGTSSISVIKRDGTGKRQLVDDTFANQEPVWSPDGKWIAFASNRGGTFDIWRMGTYGGRLEQLTRTNGVQEENPNWSPDGSQLLYDACVSVSYPCPGFAPNYEIYARSDTGVVQRLTNEPGIDNNPAWSPDGTRIVFRSDRLGFTALWLMDADGTNVEALTPHQFEGGTDPDWQPLPRSG